MEPNSSPGAEAPPHVDPVIEAYKPGVDRTIIRHNLQLTVSQRVEQLRDFMRSLEEMRDVGRRARRERP